VSLLPGWAERMSYANPILYMVNAFRYGFLGQSDVSVGVAFTVMVLATAVLYALCVWLMNRGTGLRE
jgi:ABC-2 type transport system permease protein